MELINKLKYSFKQGDAALKLIYLNAVVFLGINMLFLGFKLFKLDGSYLLNYVAMPADLSSLLWRVWTPVTYMFLHVSFFHFFFNMLTLFWFGKIFMLFFSEKQLTGLYLLGGLSGALLYLLAYNLFPLFQPMLPLSLLMGASGSIMAIVLATAMRSPNMEMRMLLLGNVKLKYIAAFFVLTSVLGAAGDNSGGQFAHLGGALVGYIFVVSLRTGVDLTKFFSLILDRGATLFRPKKMKVKQNPYRQKRSVMNDGDFNAAKARRAVEIDKILDKIKSSGYDSLTTEEKRRLFEQGNKH